MAYGHNIPYCLLKPLREDVAEQFEEAWLSWMLNSPHKFWVAFVLRFEAVLPYPINVLRYFHAGKETITPFRNWAHVMALQVVCRRWRSALRAVMIEILNINNSVGVKAFWQEDDEITRRVWMDCYDDNEKFIVRRLDLLLQSQNRTFWHHHLLLTRNLDYQTQHYNTCDPLWARNAAAVSQHPSSDNDPVEVHDSEGSI